MKVSAEVCPLCDGSGWKSINQNGDRRVTRCDCRLKARAQALLEAAHIPKRYEHCELSSFTTDFPGLILRWHWRILPLRNFRRNTIRVTALDSC